MPAGRPKKEIPAELSAEALRLRRAGGSYSAIAKELNLSRVQAERAVAEAIGESVNESPAFRAQLDLERLDAMLLALWERIKSGDTAAVDKALRVLDARGKMLDAYEAAISPPSALRLTLEDGSAALLGNPETRARKEAFLRGLEKHYTLSESAKESRVGVSTYYQWLDNDPNFRDLATAAQTAVVDRAETKLLDMGMRGHYTALISFLNANHPAYGRIRYEIIERMMLPWVEEVVKIVASQVPSAATDALRAELLRSAERAAMLAAGR